MSRYGTCIEEGCGNIAQRRNGPCQKHTDQDYVASNRRRWLQRKFGVTPEWFDEKLASQNGACAICRSETPSGQGAFHVDHCHASNKVRGLLCTRCNTGLGMFRDDTDTLLAAVYYLEWSMSHE